MASNRDERRRRWRWEGRNRHTNYKLENNWAKTRRRVNFFRWECVWEHFEQDWWQNYLTYTPTAALEDAWCCCLHFMNEIKQNFPGNRLIMRQSVNVLGINFKAEFNELAKFSKILKVGIFTSKSCRLK
jgi:hypothetical protein